MDVQGALNALPNLPLSAGPQPTTVQTVAKSFAPLFAPKAEKACEAVPIADKMGYLRGFRAEAGVSPLVNAKGTPQTSYGVPLLVETTGVEPVTPSLQNARM